MFEPDQDFALHNLDEGALKRRLEIDLAELADTDIIAGVPKDLDLKKEVMNGQENVLDSATWLQEAGLKKSYEEDRKNDTRNLPHELVQPIMLEKQEKGESSLALNRITHSDGDRNENSKPNNNMTYSSTFGRDSRDLVNELNQVKSVETFMQNGSDAHEQNGVFDSPIAVDGHGLTMAHDVCKLEEHPETQASPLVEEDRYDSTSVSDDDSEEGTESEDDEEIERQKSVHKKRIAKRKELTAAREARAQAAIRERRLLVENLEKEVMSLQHILADREEQQDREASELRASIAEVMEALEREKKAHNATKMKALLLESELENQNADLARSLGAVQWELEEKISQISEVRRIISAKEAIKADLERRIAKAQGDTYSCSEIEERTKSDDTSFEEEQSELWKKIQQCQIQAKDLEVKICGLKDSWHLPTEIEKELEIRLAQLTDYLIQKQGQVEALSAEKASLLIRVETLTRNMEESKALVSSQASRNRLGRRNSEIESRFYDMEYGLDQSYDSKIKHLGHEMASSSSMTNAMIGIPLSPILRQLNSFISTALFCLRKNRRAQAFVVLYVIILHFWFWFVVFMNPKPAPTHALQELGLPNNISEMRNASLMN
ncbi:hypothetical protein KP509_31G032300 [Ceratopteris richardii]|nr:hypothetical protein KP509_31G032300 [Ceratopteris richardii]